MLTFNDSFANNAASLSQSPRLVFVLSFDTANTDLYYITSHSDAALPSGPPTNLPGALISGGAVSQKLNPDVAAATIGGMTFTLADILDSGGFSFSGRLALKPSLRGKRVQAYMGHAGLTWSEYVLIQTQIISGVSNIDSQWTIDCEDIQRQARTDIFDLAKCRLTASLDETATTINVTDTTGFTVVEHSESYSDAGAYSVGTATATNGSPAVTLSGAADIFTPLRPYLGGRVTIAGIDYTISSVVASNQFTLTTNYTGPTGSGKSYKIWPKVGYVRIEDEVIRYTGKTSTSFTGCDRGTLGTLAKAHIVDVAKETRDRLVVEEYVYLEVPVPKLIMALLTGTLYNQPGATLPTSWHAGIPAAYLNTAEFILSDNYDLYQAGDDTRGISALFKGVKKTDAKTFIEKELCLMCGAFLPVRASGALGFKRVSAIPGYSPGALTLNQDNVTNYSELTFDMKAVKSSYEIEWGYDDIIGAYLRKNVLVDTSVTGNPNPFSLKFKGLASSKHTENQLRYLTDAYRDRYANPPMRFSLGLLPTMVGFEVGDVVAVDINGLSDPKGWNVPSYQLYTSAEVQGMTWDFIGAAISVDFMARSSETTPVKWEEYGSVLADAWYTSQGGTPITSLAGYSAGHLTTNVTMYNAGPLMAVFYHAGDLTIDSGVTVTLQKNIRLLVRGTLTINGTLSGAGQGQAGSTWPGSPVGTDLTIGVYPPVSGFYGVTKAGAGMNVLFPTTPGNQMFIDNAYLGPVSRTGSNGGQGLPVLSVLYDGVSLTGLPIDLSGQPGATGTPVLSRTSGTTTYRAAPGNGGAGGAGLMIVCRGRAIGANGKIDLSGADGTAGATYHYVASGRDVNYVGGSGAGGAPGALYCLIDGTTPSVANFTDANLVQNYGRSPVPSGGVADASTAWRVVRSNTIQGITASELMAHALVADGSAFYNPRVGADIGVGTLTNARASASRDQYLAKQLAAVEDGPIAAPRGATGLTLTSGTATLLKSADGTIIPRIKAVWTASTDQNVVGYRVYYHTSTEFPRDRRKLPEEPSQDKTEAYIHPVIEGLTYLVTVVAVNRWGFPSGATSTSHLCLGKSVPPAPVTGFTATGGALEIAVTVTAGQMPTDADLKGVQVFSSLTNDVTASDLFFTMPAVPGKQFGMTYPVSTSAVRYHWIKTQDTSGNQSTQFPASNTAGIAATPYSAAQISNANMETLSLVATGNCVVEGNQVYKNGGSNGWDSSVYSKESHTGGAFVSWVVGTAGSSLMVALTTDPLASDSYEQLDYAMYQAGNENLYAFESNVSTGALAAYSLGDVCAISYDGVNVKYYKNGAVLRTVAAAADLVLFLDSSFNQVGDRIKNLQFGPLTSAYEGVTSYTGTSVYRTTGAPTNTPTPSASPASPTITYNTNGTANIRVDWDAYTQGASQADVLVLFWSKGTSAPTLNDSSIMFNVNTSGPSYYVFEGVNPADTWSFGIAAARRTESGLVYTGIVAPASGPDWLGVVGTTPNYLANVNGTPASTVVTNAGNGATAYSGTTSYRTAGSPGGTFTFGTIVQVAASNGLINVTVPYTYAAGPRIADQFFVFVREGGGTVVAADPAFTTNAVDGSMTFGLKSGTTYTFGLSATRRTESGFESTAIQTSGSVATGVANFTDNISGTASATVLQGANRANTAINSSGNVITKVIPTVAAAPSGAGLYVANDYLGYYNGSSWRAYIDGSGNAYFGDGASNYVRIQGATGAIRGYSVVASNHLTVGSTLTSAATAGDTTLYLADTTDFPTSGATAMPGFFFDNTNDRDAFTYTGKTSNSLTGCVGVLAHPSGAVCVPAIKGMHIVSAANEMRFVGDRGDGTIEELVAVGVKNGGSGIAFVTVGSADATRIGVYSRSKSNAAIYAESDTGNAVFALTNGSYAVYGSSAKASSGRGVAGFSSSSTGGVGVYGQCHDGIGVRGESAYGLGAEFYGWSGSKGPMRLVPSSSSSAPSHSADIGTFWVTSDGVLYINTSGSTTWTKVGAQ